MLRQTLQALVRLAPRATRSAWERVPVALQNRLRPLIYPIAAGSRRGGLELEVSLPAQAARPAVVVAAGGAPALLHEAERGGHSVFEVADAAGIDRLVSDGVLDAVLVGGSSSARARAAAWGFRLAAADAPWSGVLQAFPSVGIVVPTWENARLCGHCLASLLRNTAWPSLDVVVVDNGKSAATLELVRTVSARDPRVRCIRNDENLGFARAVNQGIRASNAPYVVVLNDDVVVGPGWLSRLVARIEADPQLALVGAVTNQIGNRAQVPSTYSSLTAMEAFARRRAIEHAGELLELETVALFCAIARRQALQAVGLLDERYELGMFEDDDLSRAFKERGLRIGAAADAFVHHVGQATLGRLSDAEYLRLWEANKRRFEEKWQTRWKPPAVP